MRILACVLALGAVGGCVTQSTVTEGDRQVLDQADKGGAVVDEKLAAAAAQLPEGSPARILLLEAAGVHAVVRENVQQQVAVHGPPETSQPFSAEASRAAREQSKKDHAGGKLLGTVLAVGGVLAGVAATLAGMPWLAQAFPVLTGKIGKLAATGTRIFAFVREKAEANGGQIGIREMLKIAKEENVLAGVQKLAVRSADKLEEKLGLDFKMKLEGPPPAPAPQPAAAPA